MVIFDSWDYNFSSKDDFERNVLKINDFEIIGFDYKSFHQMERQRRFVQDMAEQFKNTTYKADFINHIKDKRQQIGTKRKKSFKELERKIETLEKIL